MCFRMKIKWLISLMFIRLSTLLQTIHCMKDNLQRVNLTAPLCLKFWQCTVLYRGTKSSILRRVFWYLLDPIWLRIINLNMILYNSSNIIDFEAQKGNFCNLFFFKITTKTWFFPNYNQTSQSTLVLLYKEASVK